MHLQLLPLYKEQNLHLNKYSKIKKDCPFHGEKEGKTMATSIATSIATSAQLFVPQ